MPGSGKSTVGQQLAKLTGRTFLDGDELIEKVEGRKLQAIIDHEGPAALRAIEERVLCGLDISNCVLAPGGSAVYSDKAMQHLKKDAVIVFLNVRLETLRKRIHNYDTRGIIRRPGQSFEELFEERYQLYKKYADHILDSDNLPPGVAAEMIAKIVAAEC
jgi:shikimate kinase